MDCITPIIPTPTPDANSLFLLLRVHSFELPIDPTWTVSRADSQDGSRTYTFSSAGSSGSDSPILPSFVHLTIPAPSHNVLTEYPCIDELISTLDSILTEYSRPPVSEPEQILSRVSRPLQPHADAKADVAAAGTTAAPHFPKIHGGPLAQDESLRGRLVLMDEASGEVVGELEQRVPIEEDASVGRADEAKDAGPVMLELPGDVYDAYTTGRLDGLKVGTELQDLRAIFVRTIPEEEQDWMTKSASMIRWVVICVRLFMQYAYGTLG